MGEENQPRYPIADTDDNPLPVAPRRASTLDGTATVSLDDVSTLGDHGTTSYGQTEFGDTDYGVFFDGRDIWRALRGHGTTAQILDPSVAADTVDTIRPGHYLPADMGSDVVTTAGRRPSHRMHGADFVIQAGDTIPALSAQLQVGGEPLDLAGASVALYGHHRIEDNTQFEGLCSIESVSNAVVVYDWDSADTATPGVYDAEFRIDYTGSNTLTAFTTDETVPATDTLTIQISDNGIQ